MRGCRPTSKVKLATHKFLSDWPHDSNASLFSSRSLETYIASSLLREGFSSLGTECYHKAFQAFKRDINTFCSQLDYIWNGYHPGLLYLCTIERLKHLILKESHWEKRCHWCQAPHVAVRAGHSLERETVARLDYRPPFPLHPQGSAETLSCI